ncbi:hypothetical protein J437_LFUL011277 [Ladona fulva]|uniref:Uncharacterized protein n=1 Tax=Ladona fulva TaxID=123851 RepID=A0A8K0KL27_LADFU|nr:hypothetical protein J437_LFUL011277 [Ladona fulva]
MERGTLRALLVFSLVLILTGDYYWMIAKLVRAISGLDISSESPTFRKASLVKKEEETERRQGKHPPGVGISTLVQRYRKEQKEKENDDTIAAVDALHASLRAKLLDTMRNSCLPKLICELNATPNKEKLTDSERALLSLIRETSISTRAETPSKYHFAAHMGLLISGVEGTGCYNFFPSCPFPGLQVLNMMKKIRINGI